MNSTTRSIVIVGAACAFVMLSIANFLFYNNRLQIWNDAALKGPASAVWPGSYQILVSQYSAMRHEHFVFELILALVVVALIALASLWKATPPAGAAGTPS